MLKDIALKYYFDQNYNCAETIIRAANEYYDLQLHDRDMRMVGAYGGGIQTGNTCGTLLGAAAVLSIKYVEKCAHESPDIKPVTVKFMRRFKERMGGTLCRDIKPVFFEKEIRCQRTVEAACDILEQVITEYESERV